MSKEGKGAAAERKRQHVVPDAALLTKYQQSLAQYRQRKRVKGDSDAETLARLQSFTARLKAERLTGVAQGASDEAAAGSVPDSSASAAGKTVVDGQGYDGEVNKDIDHRAYLPPAWRVRSLAMWRACTTSVHKMRTALGIA